MTTSFKKFLFRIDRLFVGPAAALTPNPTIHAMASPPGRSFLLRGLENVQLSLAASPEPMPYQIPAASRYCKTP
jgi:hypothetical protein